MKNDKLGEMLRARRMEKGLTQSELGEMTGVDKSYLGRIEKGNRFPSAFILKKLAKPLGYGEAEILKLAGFLSPDRTDVRLARFKETIKSEITVAMANLLQKVDSL